MKKIPFRSSFYLGTPVGESGQAQMNGELGKALLRGDINKEMAWEEDNELIRCKALEGFLTYGSMSFEVRENQREGLAKAWDRAVTEADAEGVLWTPVLDGLARKIKQLKHRDEVFPLIAAVQDQITKIKEMCKQFSLKDLREASKDFDEEEIGSAIWKYGRDISKSDIDHVLYQPQAAGLFSKLIENENLKDKVLEYFTVIVFELENKKNNNRPVIQEAWRFANHLKDLVIRRGGLDSKWGRGRWPGRHNEVAEMLLAHPDVDKEIIRRVLDDRDGKLLTYIQVKAMLHPKAGDMAMDWLTDLEAYKKKEAWEYIITRKNIAPEWIEAIAGLWVPGWEMNDLGAELIAHPFVSDGAALRIAQATEAHTGWTHPEKAEIRGTIAKRGIVRTDKKLWEVLQKSQAQEVLVGMVMGAESTAELDRAVKRLRKSSVTKLLESLKSMEIPKGVNLSQKLLAPALAKGDQKTREETIRVLGKWGKAKEENLKEEKEQEIQEIDMAPKKSGRKA